MLDRERTCAMKNRMRELRTCGTVRGEGHEVLAYSEKKGATPVDKFRNRWLADALDGTGRTPAAAGRSQGSD